MRPLAVGALHAALLLGGLATALAQDDQPYRVRVRLQPDQDITTQQTVRLFIEAEGQGSPQLSVSGLNRLTNLRVVGGPDPVLPTKSASNGRMKLILFFIIISYVYQL